MIELLDPQIEWTDGEIADVYTFHNGRAMLMKHFGEREDALA